MKNIGETDLILNPDGSAYHIKLLPGDVANTVITVGDAERVPQISQYFDNIELKKGKREFITHTGNIGGKRITVISTGIGTGNIDIALNEIDALVNIDLKTRRLHTELKTIDFVRIGTSGAIQEDIEVDSLLVSSAAFGLDSMMHFYAQDLVIEKKELFAAFVSSLPAQLKKLPYLATASNKLIDNIAQGDRQGITITAPGFYAPQGRIMRSGLPFEGLIGTFSKFNYQGQQITNIEMETAGIYGLAAALGHRAISFNVILANRITNQFSEDPGKTMDKHIRLLLDRLIASSLA